MDKAGHSEEYLAWMEARRYSVIKYSRPSTTTIETVLETGLPLDQAREKQEQLQAAEKLANPGRSCWTMDIYSIRLENPWIVKR